MQNSGKDLESAKLGIETLKDFFSQFGEYDIYTNLVLEEFFNQLYGKKSQESVSLPSEKGQEGN